MRLEKYDLLEEIGHGGMATVYRARDRRLGREVAVKIIHRHLRENAEVGMRFVSEARAVAKLKHPNIVEVYDVSDPDEEERYLVVELVHGITLRKLLANEGSLPPEVAAAIGVELAEALDHAHQLGVIHRDVKPENVLVARPSLASTNSDSTRVDVKITDFGIAKLLDAQGVTSTGQVLGSPAHMAPEQIEGGDVTARADVFGLGVLLYECMTGKLPFDGKNPAQVLRRVLDGTFTAAERVQPAVGSGYAAVLARALAHDASARFASAADLAGALRAELAALGMEMPRRELKTFLLDPGAYRKEHEPRIVERLATRAKEARERREYGLAAECYNRALAYRPNDRELLSSVSTLSRRQRFRNGLRRVAAGGALSVLAALGFVAVARLGAQPPAEPAPGPSASPSLQAPERPVIAANPAVPPRSSAPSVAPPVRAPRQSAARPVPPVSSATPLEAGVARVQILVDGPQNATVRVDGVETPWFGKIQELAPGEHLFEFLPPDDQCCEAAQTLRVHVPVSHGPGEVQTIRGRIEFRAATLDLRGAPGSSASCGALGQFPVPSQQRIPMAVAVRNVRCLLFPPEGSSDPPKEFDVTLNPGRLSTNLGQQ